MTKYIGYLFLLIILLMQGCSAQSQLVEDELETITIENLKYYLYYPKDYDVSRQEKFPLLLFLHGGGEAGGTLSDLNTGGPPKLIEEGMEFPFLVLAPQNPHRKQWWNTRAIIQLLDRVIATNNVDMDRIYLTGLSRGGAAAWELAVQHPKKFAAMAVVCGMAPLPYASWIDKELAIWVFHGEEDKSIPISESETMVEKLLLMGYDVKFTRYGNVGHNAWDKAYTTPELYDWFIKQKRKP
ncbi:putative peptidase [Saonia flava]|uniref:Putative peptidase n=1 Tax=Saonia flava TaxID=523696 RepID=A0A846QVM4_9FLAO|nr:PHB depolymerase family esterase [Saonia flava]NJB70343.1 putative peptidase [Saonia flava]